MAPVVPPGPAQVSVGSDQYASAAGEVWMVVWACMWMRISVRMRISMRMWLRMEDADVGVDEHTDTEWPMDVDVREQNRAHRRERVDMWTR